MLTSVSRPDASTTTITGTLDSTAGATYRIEFFSNDECASSGNGEGRTFLGALTGVQPNVAFTFTTTTPVSADEFITSTATNETTRDTSEFSVCIPDTTPPRVGSIVRAAGSTNPVPPGSTVTFTVTLTNVTGATVSDAQGTGTILNDDGAASAGQVIISEFRLRGPDPDGEGGRSGEFDEFIEIYNTTDADIIVVDSAPGNETDGWAIVSSDDTGTAKYVIPVGTRIPARGHFLVANFGATLGEIIPGYSLGAYAAADDSYSQDIPDGSGLALFRTANSSNFTAANRLDAVGFTTVGERFREGTGLTTPVTVDNEHSFGRKLGGGLPQDTGDNAADFALVSTDPLALGSNAVLGAPGPENRTSPIQRNGSIKPSLIDPNCPSGSTGCQNQVRDQPVAGQPEVPNQRFGTLRFRRRFTNTSGQPVTQLRFRVVTITTLNSPGYDPNNTGAGQADLRVVTTPGTNETTGDIMVTLLSNGQTIPVRGTRVETPPDQPNGGGLNSSIVTVTPVTPIAPGESVAVEFTLGVEQRGNFSFFINVEATLEEPQLGVQPAATKGIRGKAARGVAPSK